MPRLNVRMVGQEDFLSFPEIRGRKGYYLNVYTGDLFRNAGHFTEANQRIVEACADATSCDPLRRRPFLLITEDLRMSQREAKELAARRFGLAMQDLGKLVHSFE